MKLLFPAKKRKIPGKRWLSIGLRTLHLIGISGLAGAYLYHLPTDDWLLYLWLTVLSGSIMAAMEIYSHGIWLLQLRGQTIAVKLLLLGSMLTWFEQPVALIYLLIIIISGVVAHAPGKVRYYSFWHRRAITEIDQIGNGVIKDCGEV